MGQQVYTNLFPLISDQTWCSSYFQNFTSVLILLTSLFLHLLSLIFIFSWSKSNACNTTTRSQINDDTIESGGISISDINMVMKRLGMCSEFDTGKNEFVVNRDEFEGLFEKEEPSLEEVRQVFEVFDGNKDGFVDAFELSRVLCMLGFIKEGSDIERCKKMIRSFDGNGDGFLEFDDFVKFMEAFLC